MIASLTFTYGVDRLDIFKYKQKDSIDRLLRSNLDYNLYIFHNSSEEYIDNIRTTGYLNDFKINFGQAQGTYPQALRASLELLKDRGVKKLLFLQDDVFSVTTNEEQILDLIDFLKDTDLNYLNLEHTFDDKNIETLSLQKTFRVLKTDTAYFRQNKRWSFDDAPYYANIDFILNDLYDETYFSYPDIWSAEWYLKAKFDNKNILRPVTDPQLFRRVNVMGQNDWNKTNELIFLNKNFV
jgi:hypothetical protein